MGPNDRTELGDPRVDERRGGLRERGFAGGLVPGALLSDQVGGLVDLASELRLGVGEGALRRVIEHIELLGADGFAVQDGEGLDAPLNAPHAEADRLGERLELMDDGAVLRLELAGELRLRALERVAFDDRRDLFFEALDEAFERVNERGPDARRKGERSGASG